MPIDFSSSVNNISNKVFGTSIINKYLSSVLFVAILITFILIIIIMLFYPVKENTPVKILFKVGLYSFLASALILFLHNGVVKSNMDNNNMNENNEKIIQNFTNKNRDIIYNKNIPINPNVTGGNDEYDDDYSDNNSDNNDKDNKDKDNNDNKDKDNNTYSNNTHNNRSNHNSNHHSNHHDNHHSNHHDNHRSNHRSNNNSNNSNHDNHRSNNNSNHNSNNNDDKIWNGLVKNHEKKQNMFEKNI
jgi:hypothetical protein